MTKTWIYIAIGATLLLGIVLGWWLGSRQNDYEVVSEKVRYVERPATTIYVEKPTLVREEVIVHDTIYQREEVRIPTDTMAIVADYLKRRTYDLDFSTDTTGVFKVNAIVEANHLTSASATIIPLQREIERTVVKVRKFRPYLGAGAVIGSKAGVSLEVGALIKDHHLPRVGYQRLSKDNYLTIGYGYTF
jgi:hypothetical protein